MLQLLQDDRSGNEIVRVGLAFSRFRHRRSARRGGCCRALLLGGRQFLLQRLQFLRDRTIRSHSNTDKLKGFGQKALPPSCDIWKVARPLNPTRFGVSGTLKSYKFPLTMFKAVQSEAFLRLIRGQASRGRTCARPEARLLA